MLRRAGNRERKRRAHDRCDPRTAKSCGPGARSLCAKSCGDVCCPTGSRASAIRKATGAIVHRSPGRARHKPFQPSRREGRDVRLPCFPLCIVAQSTLGIAVHGSQPAPGLPCALFHERARRRSKARANKPRGCESVSVIQRSRAPDAAQHAVMRCRAGAHAAGVAVAFWVPALRSNAKSVAARPGHESARAKPACPYTASTR